MVTLIFGTLVDFNFFLLMEKKRKKRELSFYFFHCQTTVSVFYVFCFIVELSHGKQYKITFYEKGVLCVGLNIF